LADADPAGNNVRAEDEQQDGKDDDDGCLAVIDGLGSFLNSAVMVHSERLA